MGGWLGVAGWVVGKSGFNENPVVSLDLDLDFGLRLRVRQLLCPNSGCVKLFGVSKQGIKFDFLIKWWPMC